ncbi:MAG: kinase-like domain-containing protein [Monoraphidium minutum]|nr:MAG: kinase-like domain-containing protein [Monoraphidium minutum]
MLGQTRAVRGPGSFARHGVARRVPPCAARRLRCRAAVEVATAVEGGELGWALDFKQKYKMGKIIGIGFFGRVYIGSDIATGEQVAIKVMPKQRGKLTRERTLEKLLLEVESLQQLQDSPRAVRLLGVFEDDEEVQMVTELCSGGDLEQLSEDVGNLPERAVALIAYEALKMVEVCHDAQILHGDIKPANFMLRTRKDNPLGSPNDPRMTSIAWLAGIDFGCAQPVGSERLQLRAGTPTYMSPECLGRDYHFEADLWSVGATLYQLFARRTDEWAAFTEARKNILQDPESDAPLPLDVGPWLGMSPQGRALIGALLDRDYTARPTAKEALAHPWFAQWVPNFNPVPPPPRAAAPAAAAAPAPAAPAAAPAKPAAAWPARPIQGMPGSARAAPTGDGADAAAPRQATPPPPPRPAPRPTALPTHLGGGVGPAVPHTRKELPPHMREIDERAQIFKPEPVPAGAAAGAGAPAGKSRWTVSRPAWWRFGSKPAPDDKPKVSGTSFTSPNNK